MRIGFGYDAHRLKLGRRCVLCGVAIPCEFGPEGHSDADVPLHALADAMLGALALGDIGKLFPNTDPKWKNADSLKLLQTVYSHVIAKDYVLGNADITIVLQSPKISEYINEMRTTVAAALNVNFESISVKATTEEKMGFTGSGEGISATAVVLLNESRILI